MPTYVYECSACGYSFEKFQSMTEKPLRKCPECGKNKAQRVISGGAGVLFKGSGFYQTDYRSKSYKESAKKEKPAAATSACSGDCKSCPSTTK
ncbi:MAG TPA: zinc ribbon domain-containing protein [Candidatus Omnitrophota bacterium]|nr:zinc ribbon domain-containing protein [Candidatus Omnitrophota bacterium]